MDKMQLFGGYVQFLTKQVKVDGDFDDANGFISQIGRISANSP